MKNLTAIILSLVLATASLTSLAMDDKRDQRKENRKERIENYLQLTPEQAESFHQVMEAQHLKRREHGAQSHEETLEQLSGILDGEQLEKMKTHMEKRRDKRGDKNKGPRP